MQQARAVRDFCRARRRFGVDVRDGGRGGRCACGAAGGGNVVSGDVRGRINSQKLSVIFMQHQQILVYNGWTCCGCCSEIAREARTCNTCSAAQILLEQVNSRARY